MLSRMYVVTHPTGLLSYLVQMVSNMLSIQTPFDAVGLLWFFAFPGCVRTGLPTRASVLRHVPLAVLIHRAGHSSHISIAHSPCVPRSSLARSMPT